MKDITLFDIVEAKRKAEDQIRSAMKEFTDTTNLHVIDFNVSWMDLNNGQKIMSFKGIKVELPNTEQKHFGL